ncbi:MAG: hypothetical protein NZ870_02995, partial [bacterium]|nr:hypothetical protein [bacterium]
FGERDFKSPRIDFPLDAIYNIVYSKKDTYSLIAALKKGRFLVAINPSKQPNVKIYEDTIEIIDSDLDIKIKKVKDGIYYEYDTKEKKLNIKDGLLRYEIHAPEKLIFTNPRF